MTLRPNADTGPVLTRRDIPPGVLALSLVAFGIPVFVSTLLPGWLDGTGAVLIWLPAIAPAFLLSSYRGWQGASISLASGLAAVGVTYGGIRLFDLPVSSWSSALSVASMLLAVSLGAGWMAAVLLRAQEATAREAFTDALTGLPNRRHASLILDTSWGATQRGAGLAVVIFDVDHFKQVNDTHGHAEGDRVLRAFGALLRERTRRMDLSARFGGEEFIAILPNCPIERAVTFADDVRERLSRLDFGWGQVTASAGVATVQEGMGSPDVLVAAADQALYVAKDQGRNRVCRAGDALTPHATTAPPTAVPADAVPAAATPAEPKALSEVRVLLVDDDADTLRATSRLLSRLGPSVTSTSSPREAVALVMSGEPFDLLVTDIVMPEMSGFTLVDLAARAIPGLPVLYISGYEQEQVHWEGTPGARSAFLVKPAEYQDLVAAVKELLDPA